MPNVRQTTTLRAGASSYCGCGPRRRLGALMSWAVGFTVEACTGRSLFRISLKGGHHARSR